jgi:hypothetical protein
MIQIKPDCIDNALGMLATKHAAFLGRFGNVNYYACDGVAWAHNVPAAIVSRSDGHEEAEEIFAMLRAFKKEAKP